VRPRVPSQVREKTRGQETSGAHHDTSAKRKEAPTDAGDLATVVVVVVVGDACL
jgi:hypothetical protein